MAHNSNIYDDNLHVNERPLPPIGSTKQVKYDPPKRTAFWLLVTLCVLTSGLALSTIVLATGIWRTNQTPTCYEDWIYFETNGFCYYFQNFTDPAVKNSEMFTFSEAERNCKRMGGHLVSIHSSKELHFLKNLTLTDSTGSGLVMNAQGLCFKNRTVWIGLHQEHGQRWWTDGSPDVFIGADPREYIHWTFCDDVANKEPFLFYRMDRMNSSEKFATSRYICKRRSSV